MEVKLYKELINSRRNTELHFKILNDFKTIFTFFYGTNNHAYLPDEAKIASANALSLESSMEDIHLMNSALENKTY